MAMRYWFTLPICIRCGERDRIIDDSLDHLRDGDNPLGRVNDEPSCEQAIDHFGAGEEGVEGGGLAFIVVSIV